jgi:hypothetical protein
VNNIINALQRGVKTGVDAMQDSVPHRFEAAGKTIACPHCGSESFVSFGVVGLSLAGFGIQCSKCTRIQYFASHPSQIG